MPTLSSELSGLTEWLSANGISLLVGAAVLLFLYRGLRPWVHRALGQVMRAQRAAVDDDPADQQELERRIETIEVLATKALRFGVIAGIVAVILGVFNLWPALAGLGLVAAALTLAGQSVILDVIMGVLILMEAQYFKGDTVQIAGIDGVVEEVGLRRTLIRDVGGTLHSISNGTIRQSANRTRTYAMAVLEVEGVADRDVDAVIALLDEVGAGLAADPAFAGVFLDPPRYKSTPRFTASGSTLRMSGRVRPDARIRVEAEMRRRIAGELAARGIELIRPIATLPQASR